MSKLEFLIAFRYLKSKRKEGFISVITLFSFIGIIIGVNLGILIKAKGIALDFEVEFKNDPENNLVKEIKENTENYEINTTNNVLE